MVGKIVKNVAYFGLGLFIPVAICKVVSAITNK